MPRLPHALLLQAYNISPLLPLVLRGTRTLESAINELRWFREHVQESSTGGSTAQGIPTPLLNRKLLQLCQRRAYGEPLQYILGSQPFGELDIKCRPGVRPETEAYTTHLAKLLSDGHLNHELSHNSGSNPLDDAKHSPLKIVDLCSGTGCISLLLYSILLRKFPQLHITGWDISNAAISLARKNLRTNITQGHMTSPASHPLVQVKFDKVDIFSNLTEQQKQDLECDVLISNPPYISKEGFNRETSRSVRNWEPKLALVPKLSPTTTSVAPEDIFYERITDLRMKVAKSRVLLMEVGDDRQAIRIARMAMGKASPGQRDVIQIWRDWPDQPPDGDEEQQLVIDGQTVPLIGSGKMRAVFLYSQTQVPN
ncbi:uncharacterized protein BP5553_07344 [Venustampulla echinocandica]|uniref:Methyltransferase domain-containing protein n=1 Tax=Venustampulla echinocandica TaxID=2656787 RepID=A0A370TJ76_9HELO|nr:uncharacterized protein BP5553_07344 [Venustampulla echinocandica]RDL35413.1 hypothetical protein BP5553_07344 [Venustampulla echinocandica]